MATKRMFSNNIVGSDDFIELPLSAQALYFHLGMITDDDGFIGGAKGTLRKIGATENDLNLLKDAGFIIGFPDSNVIVVKHHKLNNDIKNDRYHETVYLTEKRQLFVSENKEYCHVPKMDTECIQNGEQMDTEVNVAQRNPTKRSEAERRGSEGVAPKGEQKPDLLIWQLVQAHIDPNTANEAVSRFGFDTVYHSFLRWKDAGAAPELFREFLESA